MRFRGIFLALIASSAMPLAGVVHQVEGPQDSLAGAPTINHCTLRKAIINSNDDAATYPQCAAGSGLDTIEFNFPMTVTFALAGAGEDAALTGDLDITASLIINGGGAIVDGAVLDRLFHIHPGVTVTINDLHIRNGSAPPGGGGVLVDGGTLNLNNVTISGCNTGGGDGGAIAVINGGVLNLTNSTISGNVAAAHAGGIVIDNSAATITNTTITGNSSGFANLTGGIRALGTVSLRNTIVAGNGGSDLPNLDGTFVSLGYNIIGNLGTMPGNPTIPAAIGDQIGVSDALVHLGPLQNNGGPAPTHALQPASIALDKGHGSGSAADQRGLTRPCDDALVPNAPGGDGADVGAYEEQVACSNTPPDAIDDAVTVAEDAGGNIFVLSNDLDANAGDVLSVIGVTVPGHGAATIAAGGFAVTYIPAANYFGSDSFTYTIDDGHGGTDTASVTVTVANTDDAPDAVDDGLSLAEDSGPNVLHVLANDIDVDGDPITITTTTQGAHGAVVNGGTSVTYAPATDFFGTDTFSYTVTDGHGGSDTATVQVSVSNVNDQPVAAGDSFLMNQDTTLVVSSPGVLANDTDIDGDTLHAGVVGPVAHGTLSLTANGSMTYTPAPGFAGNDSFMYVANDGAVDSGPATVTIHIADTEAPSISASVTTALLWPPNHNLVNVGFAATATDNSAVASLQVATFSDEDDVMRGGGDQAPDATDVASGALRLRAERSGTADGRVYLLIVTATDTSANTSHRCLTLVVPLSQSAAAIASVNQQAAAAAAQCAATGVAPLGFVPIGE
jgi:hypothetical protein